MAIINERKIKIAENGVLSAEAMRAYLENRLSEEEKIEFDKFIANDAFAADAFEGLREAGNVTDKFSSIDTLSDSLRERSGADKKTTATLASVIQANWIFLASAVAVIGVLVAVGIVISHQSSVTKEEVKAGDSEIIEEVAVTDSLTTTAGAVSVDSVASSSTILATDTVKAVVETPKSIVPPQPVAPVKKVSVADTVDAMSLFNSGNYIDAEKKFDKMIVAVPDNYEAHYFSAVSAYINGNSNKAEKQFDYMLDKGIYIEGSKWYKANILLKKGDSAGAKDILRSLSISSGMYKERAIKKLENLN